MERITHYQLFSLTFLFQIGTTIIFGFASDAGRDAWIVVLLSSSIGLVIVLANVMLFRYHPDLTLVEWFPKQFGKWIGTPIAWLYPSLFIYTGSRIIADLEHLIPETLLPKTPPVIFLSLFLLLIAYSLFHGIEVIGRLAGLLMPIILLMFTIELFVALGMKDHQFSNILPIAGEGWGLILKSVWPTGVTQSFGEVLVMGMIWPLVKNSNKVLKVTLLSTIVTGVFLVIADILAIIILDNVIFERAIYPLFIMLKQIGFEGFIENLDVFAVIYFIVTSYFKVFIYSFAAIRSIQILTLMQSSRIFILPVCGLQLFVGMTMTDNVIEHIMGVHMKILSPYVWVPMLFVLPGVLLLFTLLKQFLMKTIGSTEMK